MTPGITDSSARIDRSHCHAWARSVHRCAKTLADKSAWLEVGPVLEASFDTTGEANCPLKDLTSKTPDAPSEFRAALHTLGKQLLLEGHLQTGLLTILLAHVGRPPDLWDDNEISLLRDALVDAGAMEGAFGFIRGCNVFHGVSKGLSRVPDHPPVISWAPDLYPYYLYLASSDLSVDALTPDGPWKRVVSQLLRHPRGSLTFGSLLPPGEGSPPNPCDEINGILPEPGRHRETHWRRRDLRELASLDFSPSGLWWLLGTALIEISSPCIGDAPTLGEIRQHLLGGFERDCFTRATMSAMLAGASVARSGGQIDLGLEEFLLLQSASDPAYCDLVLRFGYESGAAVAGRFSRHSGHTPYAVQEVLRRLASGNATDGSSWPAWAGQANAAAAQRLLGVLDDLWPGGRARFL